MDALGWAGAWGVQLAGQTFVCLALGLWAAARCDRTPARSHAVVLLAMAAAVLSPVATRTVRGLNGGLFVGPAPPTVYRVADDPRAAASGHHRDTTGELLAAAWAVGAAVLLVGLGVGYVRGRRLVARAEPVRDAALLANLAAARAALGLRAEPELRSSPEVPTPMAWGWGRSPVVLIPDEAAGRADGVDWVSVFVHELAHIGRRDHLTTLFADVAAALLFWNPAVWLARRQLARASEFACDDRVVIAGKSPVDFAVTLLALRREALVPRAAAPTLIGSRAGLKARVRRLLQVVDPPARLGSVRAAAAVGVAALIVVGLAVAQTRPGPRPEESSAAPSVLTAG